LFNLEKKVKCGLLSSEGGQLKLKVMRFIERNTILGTSIVLFLISIGVKAGAGNPVPTTPSTSIPPGMPGGIGTIPGTAGPGGGTITGAPNLDPNGVPLPGGAGGGLPGGGATGAPNSPQAQIQEIVTPEMIQEAMRVFVKESKHIREQAETGNARQQHNLAVLYTLGLGVPLDHQRAFSWFNKAADEGLAESQFNVAIALQGGLGTRKDMVTSYKYYILSSAQGLPNAAAARDHLAQYLNREQIEAGQRMARGFLRKLERRRYYEKEKEIKTKRMQEILKGKDPDKTEEP